MSRRTADPEALDYLRDILRPGQTVYCILRHVSRSGMQRVISLHVLFPNDPVIRDISTTAARVLGLLNDSQRGGIKIGGCGMDMGFHLVYELGAALWPDGTPEPHSMRNGEMDTSGGYALKHQWL